MKNKMKVLSLLLLVTVLIFAGCSSNMLNKNDGSYIEDEITDGGNLPLQDAELAEHQPRHIILGGDINSEVQKVLSELEAVVVDTIPELNAHKIKLPDGISLTDSIRKISEIGAVDFAEPNYQLERMETAIGTDDKYGDHLWGMEAINAPAAWEITTGSEDVVVAVIDTGVQADHPDLADKVLEGFDVFENNSNTDDWQSHGTHVAGTIAGIGNNQGGVAGVSWQSPVLPIRVFSPEGYPTYVYETARGVMWLTEWARSNPDKRIVANLSLGGSFFSNISEKAYDLAIDEGIVFVVSMGNSARREYQYPAAYDGVIAVGAMDEKYEAARFSTSGSWISVTAPGVNIVSTEPGSSYGRKSGTSMSAPHVTGVAALMLSENPELTPGEVKAILEATANNLWTEGFDERYGHGLVDAEAALLFDGEIENLHRIDVEVMGFDQELEDYQLPVYKARVALYQEGEFIKDSLTAQNGQTTFHNLTKGDYSLFISYSVSGYGPAFEEYAYLSTSKEITVSADENNPYRINLEESRVMSVQANTVEIEEEIFNITDYMFINIIDSTGEMIFKDLHFPGVEPAILQDALPLRLTPGEYILQAYSINPYLDIIEETELTLAENEEVDVLFDGLEAGLAVLEFNFEDEDGNPVDNVDIELKVYREGILLDITEMKSLPDGYITDENLLTPGEYKIHVEGGEAYTDNRFYRKVGITSEEVTVTSGEFETFNITLVLK